MAKQPRRRYRYTETADPAFVIRCEWDPDTGDYDVDCHRIPAEDVPKNRAVRTAQS